MISHWLPVPFLCFDLHKFQNDFHSGIALAEALFDDPGITALAVRILCPIFVKQLCGQVNFLGISLAACSLCGNIHHRIQHFQNLTSCMQSGGHILFDFFLHVLILSNALAVDYLLDALAVLVL